MAVVLSSEGLLENPTGVRAAFQHLLRVLAGVGSGVTSRPACCLCPGQL